MVKTGRARYARPQHSRGKKQNPVQVSPCFRCSRGLAKGAQQHGKVHISTRVAAQRVGTNFYENNTRVSDYLHERRTAEPQRAARDRHGPHNCQSFAQMTEGHSPRFGWIRPMAHHSSARISWFEVEKTWAWSGVPPSVSAPPRC